MFPVLPGHVERLRGGVRPDPALAEHLRRHGVQEGDSHRGGDLQAQRTASIGFNHVISDAEQQRRWHKWV